MPEHVHVHAPHELSESSEANDRRERVMEIVAVVLMSLATVAIAWSGYQASRWSGLQAESYAEANAKRAESNRAATLHGEERLQDQLDFDRWLEATVQGNTELAELYERRFRPEFVPAFEAWVASDPLDDAGAIANPLREAAYESAARDRSARLDREASEAFDEGKDSTDNADRYIFTTVFLAGVLFFAGVSMRFTWLPARMSVLVLAGIFLAVGIGQMLTLPTH